MLFEITDLLNSYERITVATVQPLEAAHGTRFLLKMFLHSLSLLNLLNTIFSQWPLLSYLSKREKSSKVPLKLNYNSLTLLRRIFVRLKVASFFSFISSISKQLHVIMSIKPITLPVIWWRRISPPLTLIPFVNSAGIIMSKRCKFSHLILSKILQLKPVTPFSFKFPLTIFIRLLTIFTGINSKTQ